MKWVSFDSSRWSHRICALETNSPCSHLPARAIVLLLAFFCSFFRGIGAEDGGGFVNIIGAGHAQAGQASELIGGVFTVHRLVGQVAVFEYFHGNRLLIDGYKRWSAY